jgi:putative phosphoesterase
MSPAFWTGNFREQIRDHTVFDLINISQIIRIRTPLYSQTGSRACGSRPLSPIPHQIIITFPDDGTVVKRMLIGVMSDTHDDVVRTKKAVTRFNREGVEQVLHAGDFVSPFMIDTLRELKAPLTGVFGNNDGDRSLLERKSGMLPSMKIMGTFARTDVGGMRVALLHGNDRGLLETLMACSSLDLLVYGHTHRPEIRREGALLIVNPGEVYGYLTGRSTVALVDTVQRSAEIVDL